MISVAEFGHVNRQHELHLSCRQADVSSEEEEEEEEDRHEGRLAHDTLLLLGELRGLHWN